MIRSDLPVLRVARPTDHLDEIVDQYRNGLKLEILGQFKDHAGFDGVILGHRNAPYHLEFTRKQGHRVGNAPTEDNLLVFYLPDGDEWRNACRRMTEAGFKAVESFNPYWDVQGRTFEDLDGYRVVLQGEAWDV